MTTYLEHLGEFRLKLEDALYCSQPGTDATPMLEETRLLPYVKRQLDKLDPKAVVRELKSTGAWEDSDLQDHEQNLLRVLWLAAGNIREEKR